MKYLIEESTLLVYPYVVVDFEVEKGLAELNVLYNKYLKKNKCLQTREGGKHSVFLNPESERTSTIPRHAEINNFLARKICLDLGLEPIKKR